jgi:hypothetical protein
MIDEEIGNRVILLETRTFRTHMVSNFERGFQRTGTIAFVNQVHFSDKTV